MHISDFFRAKGAKRSGFESHVYQEWPSQESHHTSSETLSAHDGAPPSTRRFREMPKRGTNTSSVARPGAAAPSHSKAVGKLPSTGAPLTRTLNYAPPTLSLSRQHFRKGQNKVLLPGVVFTADSVPCSPPPLPWESHTPPEGGPAPSLCVEHPKVLSVTVPSPDTQSARASVPSGSWLPVWSEPRSF